MADLNCRITEDKKSKKAVLADKLRLLFVAFLLSCGIAAPLFGENTITASALSGPPIGGMTVGPEIAYSGESMEEIYEEGIVTQGADSSDSSTSGDSSSVKKSVKGALLSAGQATGDHYNYLAAKEKMLYLTLYNAVISKSYIPYSVDHKTLSEEEKADYYYPYAQDALDTLSLSSGEFSMYYNRAAEACYFDHPGMVEIYMCWPVEYGDDYMLFKAHYDDTKFEQLDNEIQTGLNSKLAQIRAQGLVDAGNDALTELKVHDYYVSGLSYDNAAAGKYFDLAHTAWGSLYDESCVCDGYSTGYEMILESLGIDTMVIAGSGNGGGHAWNIVQLDNLWYEVDTTWSKSGQNIYHSFFNRTTDEYAAGITIGSGTTKYTHIRAEDRGYCGFYMPRATGTKYTYGYLTGEETVVPDDIAEEKEESTDKEEPKDKEEAFSVQIGQNVTYNSAVYTVTGTSEVSLISVPSKLSAFTIPDSIIIEGKPYSVTSVAKAALKGNRKITSIKGGKNLKKIGNKAFYGCKKLKTVKMSSSNLKTIGANAFKGCHKASRIEICGNNLKSVGSRAFSGIKENAVIKIKATKAKNYNRLVKKIKKAGAKKAKFVRVK